MNTGFLVPFDGSENATSALYTAIETARAFGQKVIIINVQPTFETVHSKMLFDKCHIEEYRQELASGVLKPGVAILEKSGVDFEVRMRFGDPKEQICLEAKESNVKWILMGSRGLGPFMGGVMGSVSYGVLHKAPCPVMIIK